MEFTEAGRSLLRLFLPIGIALFVFFLIACALLFLFPPRLFIYKYTTEMIIEEEYGNDWKDDLVIENYPNLEKIVVKKNSLQNLNSLKICNNEQLKTIEIENGDDELNGAFRNVKNLIIESISIKFDDLMFISSQSLLY